MRIIIAGSRTFDDEHLMRQIMDEVLDDYIPREVTILTGGAKGADKLGERWAIKRRLKLEIYHADWQTHGKKAGFLRNQEMADNAGRLIAFWDGESRGTQDMIARAKQKKLRVSIVRV